MNAACSHCGIALLYRLRWQVFADKRRHIRAECAACGHYHHFAAQTPEAVAEADGNPIYVESERAARAEQGTLFGDET